jgi:hypothetical protein
MGKTFREQRAKTPADRPKTQFETGYINTDEVNKKTMKTVIKIKCY